MDFDSYEIYQDFDTVILHIISSQIYLAEWAWGAILEENHKIFVKVSILKNVNVQKIGNVDCFGKIAFKYILDQFLGIDPSRYP